MSQSEVNGGSYTSQDLCNQLSTLMKKVGGQPKFINYVRMSTGQGDIRDLIELWNWMHAHLDDVRKLKVQTISLKKNPDGDGYLKINGKVLDLAQAFKAGWPFPAAMGELIDNGCFGWDCIGFVSQYLITIGHLTQYETWKSNDYLGRGKFKTISLGDIGPCCILVFGNWHIVLVSGVDYVNVDEATGTLTAKVSIAQSYTGGPHSRKDCILMQSPLGKGWGPINQTGVLDIQAKCTVGRHDDIDVCYPPYVIT